MTPNELQMEIEVAGTPEEVWRAIATGPGISAWFMPAEVDEARSITYHHGPDASSESAIATWEPPNRLVIDEGEGAATEFLVEARSGGTCVVRLVASGFGGGAEEGWSAALRGLQLYLEHFRGQEAGTILAGGTTDGPAARAWAELLRAVGFEEPKEGGRVEAADPPLAGVVAGRGETTATILLDTPAPGIAFVGVGGPSDEWVFAFLRAQLFGDGADALAARDQPVWRERLAPLQVA